LVHFFGEQIFDSGYLGYFLSQGDVIWQGYGSGQWTHVPWISWTLARGSRDTMRRFASVFTHALVLFSLVFHSQPVPRFQSTREIWQGTVRIPSPHDRCNVSPLWGKSEKLALG